MFFEEREQRRLPRPSPRLVLALLATAALAAALVVLVTNEPEPEPPGPLSAARAEQRLQRLAVASGETDVVDVLCNGPVRTGANTRCALRFDDGDTQLMLVNLDPAGRLDITVPYPAQRRPGG